MGSPPLIVLTHVVTVLTHVLAQPSPPPTVLLQLPEPHYQWQTAGSRNAGCARVAVARVAGFKEANSRHHIIGTFTTHIVQEGSPIFLITYMVYLCVARGRQGDDVRKIMTIEKRPTKK